MMKTAIYIEDGVVQLVITPESDFEKDSLKSFSVRPIEAKVYSGSFYDCRGGWVRQSGYYDDKNYGGGDNNDKSLILTMREPAKIITKSERLKQLEVEIAELLKQDEPQDLIQ